jgi:hypothetical protein
MTAYRYVDGRIERVDWPDDGRPVYQHGLPPIRLLGEGPYSAWQRRRRARAGTRGRRGARRVRAPVRPELFKMVPLATTKWVSHTVSDGLVSVRLFLPVGVEVSKVHLMALNQTILS